MARWVKQGTQSALIEGTVGNFAGSATPQARVPGTGSCGRRVAGRDEPIPIVELPPGLDETEAEPAESPAEATVTNLIHRAYKKLGVANRTTLAVMVSSGAGAWTRTVMRLP